MAPASRGIRRHRSGRGHQVGTLAKQRQRVGDVGSAPAADHPHVVYQKGQADVLDLLGQDVVLEMPGKSHE